MSRIVIVPGLAVRGYAESAARAVRLRGHRVRLLRAPTWRGTPTDLERYGARLGASFERGGDPVDLLVGLSVGSQPAAVAAARSARVARLLLVSPTVDPRFRSIPSLVQQWFAGNRGHGEPRFFDQVGDWAQAGIPRIVAGFASAVRVPPLETVLPRVPAATTVALAQYDDLTSEEWAGRLAEIAGRPLLHLDGAPHSWPVGDRIGFADRIDALLEAAA